MLGFEKNQFSQVDFIEIFSGSGHLSSEMRRSGLSVAPGIDREYESYGGPCGFSGSRSL